VKSGLTPFLSVDNFGNKKMELRFCGRIRGISERLDKDLKRNIIGNVITVR